MPILLYFSQRVIIQKPLLNVRNMSKNIKNSILPPKIQVTLCYALPFHRKDTLESLKRAKHGKLNLTVDI